MSNEPHAASAPSPEGRILEVGTQVGRFRVEALLGSGTLGEVYQAWDPTLERSVAIKALRAGEGREAGVPERFRREALALSQLNHPNVCQLYDWVDHPSGAFLAMELVQGQTLDQAAPGLKVRDKLQVVRAVARALEAAHAKGVIHRDLKPSHILVAPRPGGLGPLVKVLDFGLARLGDPQVPGESPVTPAGVPNLSRLRGTEAPPSGTSPENPSYASPEQMQGQAAGSSSDVFSLGLVAWELLAGEPPFPGEGRLRLQAILAGSRRELRVRGLPSGTADLLRCMLEAHPFKRPTAAKVASALDQLLRPRRALRWAALSALGALAVAGAGHWFLGRGVLADFPRERPARLAVLPFANATGEAALDPLGSLLLPELIETALREHPRLDPMDRDDLLRARIELRLPGRGPLQPGEDAQLAAALGAQLTLRGTLSRRPGEGVVLAYELRDAGGRLRHRGEAPGTGLGLATAWPLARQVARELLGAVDPFASRPRTSLPELSEEALEAYARGMERMDLGDFRGAAPAFREAARRAPGFAPAVLGLARCLGPLAEVPPEPVFQWARWSAQAQGHRAEEMKALHHLAIRHGDQGEWEASDLAGREALALATALGEPAFEADLRATLGANRQRQNRLPEAEAEYRQALGLYQDLGDRLNTARILRSLAALQKGRGDLKGAEARLLSALEAVQAYGDRLGEASIASHLGDLALAQDGGLDRAEALFKQARALREALGDPGGQAEALLDLASVAQARGELDRAEDLARQGLEQARRAQLRPLEARALYTLGDLARAAARYAEARGRYRESLVLHQGLQDALMETHCLAGEAECLAREGRRGLARVVLARSRARSTEDTPHVLRAQAWLARSEGRPEEARAAFAKALAEARVHAPELLAELRDAAR